jgi:hypothetical protein
MDRRQVLLGAAALGLATNCNLNRPLLAQVLNTNTGNGRLSDRERAGLRGSVKTLSECIGAETESISEAEYTADGRMLVWRGRFSEGKVESIFSYDGSGKLLSITSSGSGVTDEFHYDEQGRKTRVRTVPPGPSQQGMAIGVEVVFGHEEEGDGLRGGGTVTTSYNEDDQPVESLVRDTHGLLLTRITHNYANGRLINEMLVKENLDIPSEFWEGLSGDQLSEQEKQAIRGKMVEMMSQSGMDRLERSYFYNDKGRVSRMTTTQGNLYLETSTTYNEHGDQAVIVRTQSGSLLPNEPKINLDSRSEVRYLYVYDSHSNWTEQTVNGSSSGTHRTLTYY